MYISIFIKYFHLYFTTHFFSGPFHICLPRNTQRVRQTEGLLKNFLQKNPTSAPVYQWWGKVFSKHRLLQWFSTCPETTALHISWNWHYCVCSEFPQFFTRLQGSTDPRETNHCLLHSLRGDLFWPRCIRGHWPGKESHSLCTGTAWSFTAALPSLLQLTLNTLASSDNVCKALQGSRDESLLRLKIFTLRRMRWRGGHSTQRI